MHLLLPPLPPGEGWGEGVCYCARISIIESPLTLTLSRRERGPDEYEACLFHKRLHALLPYRSAPRHQVRRVRRRRDPGGQTTRVPRGSGDRRREDDQGRAGSTGAGGEQRQRELLVRLLAGRAAGAVLRAEPDQPEPQAP